MAEPVDPILYRKMKDEVDKSYKKPSAYRSMAYQRFYLKAFAEKYGADKSAFKGKNPKNLGNWRKEKWVDVKTLIADPKNPVACGNAPVGKDEYPLCMPIKEAAKYSEGELKLLVKRKSEIKEKRLVKDAYLRDVLRPEETPAIRKYKEKYITDKKMKIKPLPANVAEKILEEPPLAKELKIKVPKEKKIKAPTAPKEPKPQVITIPTIEQPIVEKPKRGRGRPKLSTEQLAANKAAAQAKRKEDRQRASALFAEDRKQAKEQKAAERQRLKDEAKANAPPKVVEPKNPTWLPGQSPEWYDDWQQKKVAYNNYVLTRNRANGGIQFF
jgi:hypothetical protein